MKSVDFLVFVIAAGVIGVKALNAWRQQRSADRERRTEEPSSPPEPDAWKSLQEMLENAGVPKPQPPPVLPSEVPPPLPSRAPLRGGGEPASARMVLTHPRPAAIPPEAETPEEPPRPVEWERPAYAPPEATDVLHPALESVPSAGMDVAAPAPASPEPGPGVALSAGAVLAAATATAGAGARRIIRRVVVGGTRTPIRLSVRRHPGRLRDAVLLSEILGRPRGFDL